MQIDGDGDPYQLTPDDFQRLEKCILKDVQMLKCHVDRSPLVQRCVVRAEDNLNRARELRADARFHAAEMCLVEALLKVNDALSAASSRRHTCHFSSAPFMAVMYRCVSSTAWAQPGQQRSGISEKVTDAFSKSP
jgi:hypothetical protein